MLYCIYILIWPLSRRHRPDYKQTNKQTWMHESPNEICPRENLKRKWKKN